MSLALFRIVLSYPALNKLRARASTDSIHFVTRPRHLTTLKSVSWSIYHPDRPW